MTFLVNNVLIIGPGLIGGSLAKALRERQLIKQVMGFGRQKASLLEGVRLGVLDGAVEDLPVAISQADLIVLAVPTLTIKDYLPLINTHRKPHTTVTDVASVKGEIAHAIIAAIGEVPSWFVLGHPIAGSELSGIAASDAQLFVKHKVILTPLESTEIKALALVSAIWEGVGAEVHTMTVEMHDKVLAATSHLPHALAFTLVNTLADLDVSIDVFRYTAGGFRDFTRIASSHPVMWHDIVLANKDAILDVLGSFKQTLASLEEAIASNNSAAILQQFEKAKAARDHYSMLMLQQEKD